VPDERIFLGHFDGRTSLVVPEVEFFLHPTRAAVNEENPKRPLVVEYDYRAMTKYCKEKNRRIRDIRI